MIRRNQSQKFETMLIRNGRNPEHRVYTYRHQK